MQFRITETKDMSFDFNSGSISNQFKAGAAYKDGSGMGGGGMYFQQGKKRKDQPEEDIFEFGGDKDKNSEADLIDMDLKEEDIPMDNIVNKFTNWFRKKNH